MEVLHTLPAPIRAVFSRFPLASYPSIEFPKKINIESPTLWIVPSRSPDDALSSDVECLKWQAYLALRGMTGIATRTDIVAEGAVEGRLPNLQIPTPGDRSGNLLTPQLIPAWVDEQPAGTVNELEGYKDQGAKDESHAWIALLEGNVHAALLMSEPEAFSFSSMYSSSTMKSNHAISSVIAPPAGPLFGFGHLFPSPSSRVSPSLIETRYREAIGAISDRLGSDEWFLGSNAPTPVDALVFAYLHTLLHSKGMIRFEVTRRVNLVTWELRVRSLVRAAFTCPLTT